MPSTAYHHHDGGNGPLDVVIPDVYGAVIGYRAWKVVSGGVGSVESGKLLRLVSATYGSHWPVDDYVVATCNGDLRCANDPDGEVPGVDCSCGLYAAKDLDQLRNLGYGNYDNGQHVVMGEVALVGKVIPGDQGWRASHARINKLLVPYEKWKLGAALSATYGVPYELMNTLRAGLGR